MALLTQDPLPGGHWRPTSGFRKLGSAMTAELLEDPIPAPQGRLLVVDDEESVRRVVAELLEAEGYFTESAASAHEALDILRTQPFDLVLTDIKMNGRDGLWLLEQVHRNHPDASVVLMTGFGQVDTAVRALKHGAEDYLTKPIRIHELSASIERALQSRRLRIEHRAYQQGLETAVREKTRQLEAAYVEVNRSYDLTLEALVTALDARECETGLHSQRVVRLTTAIAERMGVSREDQRMMARGALLHDIGKIGVPDRVLLKPGKLDEEEWVEMRRHPEIGARILSGIPFLKPALEIVLTHQEKWDGTGYPGGLAGREIPLGSRIFAVADAVDAICSDRPYRRGRPFSWAREEIERCGGTQFDPDVVKAFLTITEEEYLRYRREHWRDGLGD